MADEPVRLSPRAEDLLASFGVPERDWEADARAIDARLKDVVSGSTEAKLLDAPLPEEAPDEASEPKAAAPPATTASASPATATPAPKSAPSLAELARSVAGKNSRPQATDIAKESLSVAAQARTHTDAIVERVRSSRAAAAKAPPPPPSHRPARAPATSAPPSAANDRRSSSALPWIVVGGLGATVAMLLFNNVRSAEERDSSRSTAQVAEQAPAVPAAKATAEPPPPESVARATAGQQGEAAPAAEVAAAPGVAASALPLAARASGGAAAPAAGGALAAKHAQQPAAAGVAEAAPARPEPEAVVLEDSPSKTAGAPAHSGLRPAAGAPSGGLPDRPSTGAVQAAIGSVMGGARSCVAGATTPTPAQVTFGADGTVKTVSVAGASAGTPAATCIESALKRARVAPFATPTFTLMVWVRP